MKRMMIRVAFPLSLALIACLVGLQGLCLASEAGQVLAVKKNVYLVRAGGREQAQPQSPLYAKDAVQTDQDARTKLFFHDDSVLNLGPLSQVSVEEYLQTAAQERSKSVYRLVEGSLKVVVGRSELEIHSPTAVAAARGTKFIMWLEGSGDQAATGLLVLEGEVLLRNIRDAVKGIQRVQAGQMSRVPVAQPPAPPRPADPQVMEQHGEATSAIGSVFEKGKELLPEPTPPGGVLAAGTIRSQMELLQTPPIVQEPVAASHGGNVTVTVTFP